MKRVTTLTIVTTSGNLHEELLLVESVQLILDLLRTLLSNVSTKLQLKFRANRMKMAKVMLQANLKKKWSSKFFKRSEPLKALSAFNETSYKNIFCRYKTICILFATFKGKKTKADIIGFYG